MSYSIILHPEAVAEITDAYSWYEERSKGLGNMFIDAINKRLTDIAQHPERYPKRKAPFREALVELFPYVIIYEFVKKEQAVFVSYVFHTKRNPRLKYKK